MHAAIQQNSRSPGTCAGFNIIYIYIPCVRGLGFYMKIQILLGQAKTQLHISMRIRIHGFNF